MPVAQPSSGKIRVLIVDDIAETRENVKKLLFFEDDIEVAASASSGTEGVELAAKLQPDIVLMDINMPGMDGIAASEMIATRFPNVQVIMMSVQGEADYLRRSMLAGAREFLIKPFSSDELATSIRRVYQLGATRRAQMPPPPPVNLPSAPPLPAKGGKVIAVFGSKGGCGASTIAVNLAVALKEGTGGRVAMIDANLEMGDLGVFLNLPSTRTMADLTGGDIDIDEEVLNTVMATHGSGLKVLLAPPRPEMAELITVDLFKKVFSILTGLYDYIVVDVWRSFREPMVYLLDTAEQIVLVSTSEIPSIKNAKLFFELTQALEYPPEKTLFVINKEDGRTGISTKDIASSMNHAVSATIPKDERTTLLALNRGTPFVSATQRTLPVTQSILGLARLLRKSEATPAPARAPARPRLLGRL